MRNKQQRRLFTLIVGIIPLAIIWTAAFILTSAPATNTIDTLPTIAALPDTVLSDSALNQQSVSSEAVAYVAESDTKASTESIVMAGDTTPEPTDEPLAIEPPEEPVPDQIVLTFPADLSADERSAYIASIGGSVVNEIPALNTVVVNVPNGELGVPAETSNITFTSEPDYYVVALQEAVNDPLYTQQWALPAIQVPSAWTALAADAPQVLVAVIDSGVCLDHPDLAGRISAGYDFVQQDSTPQDDFGHGCGVAGIIAANGNNAQGMAGIAPNASIMPLRVLNGQGVGQYSDVAAAIVYAADHDAQIINLSLGGAYSSTVLERAIDYAVSHGVIVIAAAGNTGGSVLYPAAYAPVVAVGSVDQSLQRSSFSSFGAEIDLYAPGRDIVTTKRDGLYGVWNGTSFAAPQVAGVAALEIAFGHTLTLGGGIVSLSTGGTSVAVQPTPTAIPTAAGSSPSTFTGYLHIWHGDPPTGSNVPAQVMIVLVDNNGSLQALLSMDFNTAQQLEGQQVQVTGQSVGQSAQGVSVPTVIVESVESILADGLADVDAALFGSFPYINVLCMFNGNSFQPELPSWYSDLFANTFPGMDHYWREISYNNIDISGTGTVNQWFTMPHNRLYYRIGENNYNLAQMAADCATAANASVNFLDYYGINFMFNETMDCCAWGGATNLNIDGQFRQYAATWLPPWAQQQSYLAHEMGHAFGLPHSSGPSHNPPSELDIYVSEWDTMSVAGGACFIVHPEYGCIAPGTIAYHLDLEGWIPAPQRATIHSGETLTLTMERTNLPQSSDYLIARIPIGGSSTHFYTVEVRNLSSYDTNVPGNAVIIHDVDIARSGNTGPALIVDGDINNNVNDAGAMWLPGETYYDALNNIRIEVLSASGSTFDVRISNNVFNACDFNIADGDRTAFIDAINTANGNGVPDTICLANAGIYNMNAVNNMDDGANAFPVITSDITILGNNSQIGRDIGLAEFRFFHVGIGGSLTLNRVRFLNGVGGAVTEFLNNPAGGAIYSEGYLSITDSMFSNNRGSGNSTGYGGAIAVYQGYTSIGNTSMTANAASLGGAVYNQHFGGSTSSSLLIGDSLFDYNQAANGGALYNNGNGTVNVSDNTLLENQASGSGGGLYNNPTLGSNVAITNNCISGNTAPSFSGIYHNTNSIWLNATNNWWGMPTGPGAYGGGAGDAIGDDYIEYYPYRTSPIRNCQSNVPNDGYENAYVIDPLPFTRVQDVFGASVSDEEPDVSCAPSVTGTVWYTYSPVSSEVVEFNTFNSYYDTVMAVFQGSPGSWTELFCSDDTLTPASFQSKISFTAFAGQTYYVMVGQYGSINLSAPGAWLFLNARTVPPSNDSITTPIVMSPTLPYTNTQSMLSATVSTSAPIDPVMSCANDRSRTVWYTYQPTESRTIIVDTMGSTLDTVLGVYTGTPGSLTQVACNDDANATTQSEVQFNAMAGIRYYIVAAEFGATPTCSCAMLTINAQAVAPLVFNSPTGTVTDGYGNPTYEWTDIPGVQYYYLLVLNSAGTQIINEVLSDAGYCNGTTCSIDMTDLRESYRLANGTYTIYMNTWDSNNMGIWRGPFYFTLNAPVPLIATLNTTTNTNLLRPTFNWSLIGNAGNATYFNLVVSPVGNPSAPSINQWFSRSASCGSPITTNCALVSPIDLADNTNYTVYLRSYGPGGLSTGGIGGYAGPSNFLLDAPQPALPDGIVANINQGRVSFNWNDDPNATYFNVYVTNNAGASLHNVWYARADVCPTSTCSVAPVLSLVNGTYQVRIKAYGPGGLSTGGVANSGFGGPVPFVLGFSAPNINELLTFAPTGAITTGSPTFSWNTIAGSTYYLLWVGGVSPSFTPIFQQWYDASAICTTHPGTCTVSNVVSLPVGNATWRIQAYGPGGTSAIYNNPSGIAISVNSAIPTALTLNTPTGVITTNMPAFSWNDNPNVDYYNVYVNSGITVILNQWYRAERGVGKLCDAGVCTLNNAVTIANGNYTWNVRAYAPAGLGAWATALNFNVAVPAPDVPVQMSPNDGEIINNTNRPTITWNTSAFAAWYHLQVFNGMGTVIFDQWYQANVGGCNVSTCGVQLPNPIAYGNYVWRVQAYSQGGVGLYSPFRSFFSLSMNTQPLMVQADANTVQRRGTWNTTAGELAVGQSYLTSSGSPSDTLTFGFTGTEAQVVYIAGAGYGSFVIEVDGVPVRAVNAYAAQTSVGNLAAVSGLLNGDHVLRIIPLGGAPVAIDGLIVTGEALIRETPVPPASPTIIIPTITPTEEVTPVETVTPTPEVTETPVVTETPTDTPVPTDTPTEIPTETPTELPTEIPTELPTDVPTETPTP
jgi:thermitase